MSIARIYGGWRVPFGPNLDTANAAPAMSNITIDAANESAYIIGYIATSDGGTHTIDTTGSSAMEWRTGTTTFANAGTTVKVGFAAVDMTAGPPGRPVNVADVVTYDVSKTLTGGGITTAAWQTHVPDAGTKTIAHGDLVCFCIQATARAGVDSILVSSLPNVGAVNGVEVAGFTGGAYTAVTVTPNAFITFSDGATGFFHGGEVLSTITARTWNSASATKEYGQLYKIPFPVRIYGLYGITTATADYSAVLYSDPLGTPVAERTVAIDFNTVGNGASTRRFSVLFSSPYDTTTDQLVGAVLKPGASNVSSYFKTLNSAAHRISDPWGTQGYGISRASGAFADANSGLDHYLVGLLTGGGEVGGGGGGIPASRILTGM